MLAKGYVSEQIFGQIQIHPFSKSSLSQLGGNASHQYHVNDLNGGQIDWRKDPRISCFRDLVRNRIAESCELGTNYQWQEQASNLVNSLENQLFMEASSKEEYMNQDVLRQRLQCLLKKMMVDLNCSQLACSYTGPTFEVMPTLGLTHGFNSATVPPFDRFTIDIVDHNSMVADNTDKFSFLKGLLDGNKPEVANMCTDSNMRQISNEMLLSSERSSTVPTFSELSSTITTSSHGEGFSEFETFDGGSLFSRGDYQYSLEASSKDSVQRQLLAHGVANNQNEVLRFSSTLSESSEIPNSILQISEHAPQLISGDSIFPSMDIGMMNSTVDRVLQPKLEILEQKQQQSYSSYKHLHKALEDETPCYFSEKIASKHFQFPSEQSHGIHVASESSSLAISKGTAGLEKSSNDSSVEQRILLAYVSHKSSASSRGDCMVSFVNHLHSTMCNNCMCLCERFFSLLSHFDNCHSADCYICSPVRYQSNVSKCHQNFENMNNGLLSNSSNIPGGGSGFCSSEIMLPLPPAKRLKRSLQCSENSLPPSKDLKMEKSSCLPSENRFASVLAPLLAHPFDPEGLPPLQQLPESPVSINSEVLEGTVELSKPMRNSSNADQTRQSAGNEFSKLSDESSGTPEEPSIGPKAGKIDPRSFSVIADAVKDEPHELRFDTSSALSEELGSTSKEEVIQVMPNCDLTKLDIETEKEDVKPNPKVRGVSLIEFFSADEIRDHISSLRRWMGQRISKEEEEKQGVHCANDNTCQLCAADKLLLAPVPIYCSSCGSRIKRSVIYYSTSEENGMRHCFCTSCFKCRGGHVKFHGITIPKAKLDKKKNDEEIEEPWVQCDKCKGWQHQICALFNDKRDMEGQSEYVCPKCCLEEIESGEYMPVPNTAVFGAKDLPSTLLSDYIQQRLFRRLRQEREERAKVSRKNLDEVPAAEDLIVRVVLSVNKQLKVKQQFLEMFHDGNYPEEFPYQSKVILLFQKIEGVDICLFGMYVQEFGSECSQPNHRCVYISYLDSVKYFRPEAETAVGEALRTFVYHEILIGYLEYCKKRGFVACYLWACPPLKGEDYILYCHPETQKTPKSDKLRQWYHSMLRKASEENIVVNFTNLYDHFFVPTGQLYSKVTAARLPYFDGDYWSSAAENVIKNIEQQNEEHSGRKMKKVMTKRTLKAMGHTNPSGGVTKDILLMQKLGQTISPVKEDFIVVHLQFVCTYCHEVILNGWRWCCSRCKNFQLCERCHNVERGRNGGDTHTISSKEKHLLSKVMVDDVPSDTKDEDVILETWLFENRHIFLGLCQKNHYQFDTLRQAKHSSMMILHHLHNPIMPTDKITCNICLQDTCTGDSNVCATCCNKKFSSSRIHRSAYNPSVPNGENEDKYAQQKILMLKELLNVLQHADKCKATSNDPCHYPNCHQIKRLFLHGSKCTIRLSGGCKICQKLWYILRLHSKTCEQTDCSIPRCRDLKNQRFLGKPNTPSI